MNVLARLSTLALAPIPGSNGVGSLRNELTYLRAHTPFKTVDVVPGTEPFKPNLIGAISGA